MARRRGRGGEAARARWRGGEEGASPGDTYFLHPPKKVSSVLSNGEGEAARARRRGRGGEGEAARQKKIKNFFKKFF